MEDESSAASHPQSAFLGPTLWDKTLPYDGDGFQLEYMDLDEFLLENGIPANTAQSDQASQKPPPPQVPLQQAPPPTPPTPSSVVDLSSHATTSVHTAMAPQTCLHSPSTAGMKQPDVHVNVHLRAQMHVDARVPLRLLGVGGGGSAAASTPAAHALRIKLPAEVLKRSHPECAAPLSHQKQLIFPA